MTKPKIITYVNLVHKFQGSTAKEVINFLEQNKEDIVFIKRAETFNRLFDIRNLLCKEK